LHHRQAGMLGAKKGAKRIDLEIVADIVGRHVLELLAVPNRGTVYQDIEPTKSPDGLVDEEADRTGIAQIGLVRHGLDTPILQVTHRLSGFSRGIVVMNDEGIASVGQSGGDVPADAAPSAAGNQRDFGSSHVKRAPATAVLRWRPSPLPECNLPT